jgi:hypothetical protein
MKENKNPSLRERIRAFNKGFKTGMGIGWFVNTYPYTVLSHIRAGKELDKRYDDYEDSIYSYAHSNGMLLGSMGVAAPLFGSQLFYYTCLAINAFSYTAAEGVTLENPESLALMLGVPAVTNAINWLYESKIRKKK